MDGNERGLHSKQDTAHFPCVVAEMHEVFGGRGVLVVWWGGGSKAA